MEIKVDLDDLPRVLDFPHAWGISDNGRGHIYATASCFERVSGKVKRTVSVLMHRFIMNAPKGCQVDHINHDTLDNRKSNLRFVSRTLNCLHRNKPSVRFIERSRQWEAELMYRSIRVPLGRYASQREAELVYAGAIILAERLEGFPLTADLAKSIPVAGVSV
jgi:hypothetical protein